MKRKLIASVIFDLETAPNTMYMPLLSISWLCGEKEKPIEISIRYAWMDSKTQYNFTAGKKIFEIGVVKFFKDFFKERHPDYEGLLIFDDKEHFYLSDFGKSFAAADNQKIIEKWIESGAKF